MTRLMLLLCVWLSAIALIGAADAAHAGSNFYSYVSNTGSDSNGCSNPTTDACASFTHALSETLNYGEIDCVNAGHYGQLFTISQSVTIDCAGGVGSTYGQIIINGAGIVVRLRHLSLNSDENMFYYGINAENMAALYVENCVITNYNLENTATPLLFGIEFAPSTGPSQLFVTNTVISDNGNTGADSAFGFTGGILILPASGVQANVNITRSKIQGNIFGIIADGTQGGSIRGVVKDSVVSGNIQNGITASSSGSSVVLMVEGTDASSNGNHGLVAGGSGAGMLVRTTSVFNNGGGLYTTSGGTLYSYGNNKVNGNNGNDGSFTGTVSQQ
jgi:hypothetical protein